MTKYYGTIERIMLKVTGVIAVLEHIEYCEDMHDEGISDMLILPLEALHTIKEELHTLNFSE